MLNSLRAIWISGRTAGRLNFCYTGLALPLSVAPARFKISDSRIQAFLDGLLRTAIAQRLRDLQIDASEIGCCAGDMACVKRFLRAVHGPCLEEFDWRYHFSDRSHVLEVSYANTFFLRTTLTPCLATPDAVESGDLLVPCMALRKLVVRPHFSLYWLRPLSWS